MWIIGNMRRAVVQINVYIFSKQTGQRCFHVIPILDLYEKTTGETTSQTFLDNMKKRHPNIDSLTHDRLQCTLQILQKFNITAWDACLDMHVFTMNPITMDNYGEILRECGFKKIIPINIIRYHTLIKSRTISRLKKEGLLRENLVLEKLLQNCFPEWPANEKCTHDFPESSTNILTVRMTVLENYLRWRLSVTPDEFRKYCRNYLPMKHKPMADIQEALNIAQNHIKFNQTVIRKNGFIVSADPINTKLIIENVGEIAGMEIQEAIKLEPAILKNNYNALLRIRTLLEEYRIPEEAQRKCLRVYCMCPKSVQERLEELRSLKEYQVLRTNPRSQEACQSTQAVNITNPNAPVHEHDAKARHREDEEVLTMVVHKKKMMDRLEKIYAAKKQCYSLNHLVASSKVFNNYISSFGNKICARDLTTLIRSSLRVNKIEKCVEAELNKRITKQIQRHKYWLYTALTVVDENIRYLKKRFDDSVISNNCQLLLYPNTEIEQYIDLLLKIRNGEMTINESRHIQLDASYNNLRYSQFDDDQILSLVLYEIEKKYHFSGDGIWVGQDGIKADMQAS